jgi:hypothetical protein
MDLGPLPDQCKHFCSLQPERELATMFRVRRLIMTNALVPDWIKKIKAQQDRDAAIAQATAQRQALLTKTIKADGPDFWRDLLKELHVIIDSLPLIGLRAQMADIPSGTSEEGQEITVFNYAVLDGQTCTNIFYGSGARAIRCHPQNAADYRLEFCLNGKLELSVTVIARGPMTAAEAARCIVEPMAEMKAG